MNTKDILKEILRLAILGVEVDEEGGIEDHYRSGPTSSQLNYSLSEDLA